MPLLLAWHLQSLLSTKSLTAVRARTCPTTSQTPPLTPLPDSTEKHCLQNGAIHPSPKVSSPHPLPPLPLGSPPLPAAAWGCVSSLPGSSGDCCGPRRRWVHSASIFSVVCWLGGENLPGDGAADGGAWTIRVWQKAITDQVAGGLDPVAGTLGPVCYSSQHSYLIDTRNRQRQTAPMTAPQGISSPFRGERGAPVLSQRQQMASLGRRQEN